MPALRYAFDEALANLRRGGRLGLLSGGTIVVALFVLGGFALAASNLTAIEQAWDRSAELSVYLTDETTDAERAALDRVLGARPGVSDFRFVSKQEALERFKTAFADLAGTIESVGEKPAACVHRSPSPGGPGHADRPRRARGRAPPVARRR